MHATLSLNLKKLHTVKPAKLVKGYAIGVHLYEGQEQKKTHL